MAPVTVSPTYFSLKKGETKEVKIRLTEEPDCSSITNEARRLRRCRVLTMWRNPSTAHVDVGVWEVLGFVTLMMSGRRKISIGSAKRTLLGARALALSLSLSL